MTKEIKYSYSRLDTYDQCCFRYFLKYIEGNYASTGSVALEFGTLIHATEEEIGNCIREGKEIPYEALIKNFMDKCMVLSERYATEFMEKDKSDRTYPDKINFYINTGIYRLEKFMKENPDLELVGCEVPFTFSFAGRELFRGSIDRVLRNKVTGKYTVHDIKSYSVPLNDGTKPHTTKDSHLVTPLQFVIYCQGLKDLYGADPNEVSCGYDLPLCDMIQPAGTKGFITRGEVKIAKIFNGIYKEIWDPKPTRLCHWCEFCATNGAAGNDTRYLCPYFMQWTKENKVFTKENDYEGTGGITGYKSLLEAYHKANGYDTLVTKKN